VFRSPSVLAAYLTLYFVWGSTYLAMHVAAETMPPFMLAAMRFAIAGTVLFGFSLWRKEGWPSRAAWQRSALVGLFLLVGGNGVVTWAVQRVPTGVAALLVATTPLWLSLISGDGVTRRLAFGLVLGFAGIGLLVGPSSLGAGAVDVAGAVALVGASLSWAIGSIIQRNAPTGSAIASSGMQMLCGAGWLTLVSIFGFDEQLSVTQWSGRSLAALAYLTVAGSLIGFTSYAWLMKREPAARVATYAYVNPVVAIALGAWLANEALGPRVGAAAVVIILGVVVILAGGRTKR
jgi:drug/metabolite transporter (DMT)-like permease